MAANNKLSVWKLTLQRKGLRLTLLFSAFVFITNFYSLNSIYAENPQYGGTYTSIINPARSYDPHFETWPATTIVTANVYNGILRMNNDMSDVELDLAASWKQIDEVTYEFKIRKGVHFHDIPPVNGRELTSSDVKYSIERISGMHGEPGLFKHRYTSKMKLRQSKHRINTR